MRIPSIAAPAAAARRDDRVPAAVATGRVVFWPGGSLWIGRGGGRTDRHSHHALQIALPLDGRCRFRASEDEAWREYDAAVVRPDRPHQLETDPVTMAHLFVEPETVEGRALLRRFDADISPLPEPARRAVCERLRAPSTPADDPPAAIATARAALASLCGLVPHDDPPDARILRGIERIRSGIDGPVSLADAAAAAALSPSRFRHLFVEQVGTSFRAYVLWTRLKVAVGAAMRGASWTAAAHEAGFADSAHLHRTFRRMLGVSPSGLIPE